MVKIIIKSILFFKNHIKDAKCCVKIIKFYISLFILFGITESFSSDNKSYLGTICGLDYGGVHIWSDKKDTTVYDINSLNPFSIGFCYAYDFFMINYQASTGFDRHMSDIHFTNNHIVFRNNLTYQNQYKIERYIDGPSEGPGWSDEYQNMKVDASSLQYTGEIGYMFSFDFLFFKEISYKMLFLHNELQKPGFGIGLLTGAAIDYSALNGKEILIPEGERSYYNRFGTFKGDEIVTVGAQITPIITYMFFDISYLGVGAPIMVCPLRYGKVITEEENVNIREFDPVQVNFFLTGGIRIDSIMISIYLGGNCYKRYNVKEGYFNLYESVNEIELHTGIMF